jgi:hypothetical protein
LPDISKINALAIGSVSKVDGLAKASILDINGITVTPSINPTAPTSGFLFTYPGAAVAYSVRQLNNNAPYVLRVRRVTGTGNTGNDDEADVKFDTTLTDPTISLDSPVDNFSAGGSNATTLGEFLNVGTVGGTTYSDADSLSPNTAEAYVDTWYDLTGNQNHAEQTTPASQPQIHDGTVNTDLITENSKPAVSFDGSNDYLSLTSTASTNSVCQILVSVYDTSTSTLKMPLGGGAVGTWWQHYSASRTRINTTSGQLLFGTGLSAGTQFLGFMNGNSGAYTFHLNGASKVSTTAGNWYIDTIGRGLDSATYAFDNVIQEVILYESEQSSSRTGIETNINGFFGIY